MQVNPHAQLPHRYIMESPEEGNRLEAKTVKSAARRQLRLAGLAPGMHALDVGCGTGAVTRVMASIAGPGRVLGIDSSDDRLSKARALAERAGLAVAFARGDACRLALPDAAFDFSWSRFLFEYLPAPERALAEMVRVTRPGGIVAVAQRLDRANTPDGGDLQARPWLPDGFLAAGLSGIRVARPRQRLARTADRDAPSGDGPVVLICGRVPMDHGP